MERVKIKTIGIKTIGMQKINVGNLGASVVKKKTKYEHARYITSDGGYYVLADGSYYNVKVKA